MFCHRAGTPTNGSYTQTFCVTFLCKKHSRRAKIQILCYSSIWQLNGEAILTLYQQFSFQSGQSVKSLGLVGCRHEACHFGSRVSLQHSEGWQSWDLGQMFHVWIAIAHQTDDFESLKMWWALGYELRYVPLQKSHSRRISKFKSGIYDSRVSGQCATRFMRENSSQQRASLTTHSFIHEFTSSSKIVWSDHHISYTNVPRNFLLYSCVTRKSAKRVKGGCNVKMSAPLNRLRTFVKISRFRSVFEPVFRVESTPSPILHTRQMKSDSGIIDRI